MPDQPPFRSLRDFITAPIGPPPMTGVEPPPLTGWRRGVDEGINALVGTVKGVTGLGDQGPAGPTWPNAGALLAGVLPFTPKGLKAFATGEKAIVHTKEGRDLIARATALYFERGGGDSPARMAQALKDAGYKFGPMKTAADKRAANAFVDRLLWEANAPPPQLAPDSPFAGSR